MHSTNSKYGPPTWPQVTSLSLLLNLFMPGCANHFTPYFLLNEGQFKAGFVKKLKLKLDYFHRREGRGEQSSLACKEICTETSHCERSCF